MEHIRQCSKEHTSSPFYVAEDVARLRPVTYLGAVLVLPFANEFKKRVSFFLGTDSGHLEEDPPELPGIRGLRDITAPNQSLPLNVDQATLHGHIRPKAPECVGQVRVAINSEAAWAQAPLFQTPQEYPKLRTRAFRDSVLANHERMHLRIHQCHKATGAMNKCSVQDEVLVSSQVRGGLRGRLLDVVINHTVQLSRAVPALTSQLPDRVAFDNPASEPLLFVGLSDFGITPTKRVPAPGAIPSLPTVSVMPVPPGNAGTPGTVFF